LNNEIELRVIGVNDEVPIGFRFIESWEVEKALCENFKVFKDLELSIDVGYYKINNKDKIRYLWLARLDLSSRVYGYDRVLNLNFRVRGVLICKK
jgi:hypothetical protein